MEQWQDVAMKNLSGVFKIPPCCISANASLCGKKCQKVSGRRFVVRHARKLSFLKVMIESQKLDQKGNGKSLLDHLIPK